MKRIIVIGNGMTSYKFCEKLVDQYPDRFEVIVIGEEPRPAYDRVNLTSYFNATTSDDLLLGSKEWYSRNNINLITGELVTGINREEKYVKTHKNSTFQYDWLIMATGSKAFVPSINGVDKQGVFVYRTIEDLDAIKKYSEHVKKASVIGGGLLGLEAAKALYDFDIETSVVELAPRLMPRQLDDIGGEALKNKLEDLGLDIYLNRKIKAFEGNGKVEAVSFLEHDTVPSDMVVISAGISPRDELAKKSGLEVGPRGGIKVNNQMVTTDPSILAVGECALVQDQIWGLVAPCYEMAEIAIHTIMGGDKAFAGYDMSTKLKLIGVDVASFGDAFGTTEGSKPLILQDLNKGLYKRLNISPDGKYLLGGILVGDASQYTVLHQYVTNTIKIPEAPESLIINATEEGSGTLSVSDLPDEATVCSCENVSKGLLMETIEGKELTVLSDIKKCTKAGTGCGGCLPMVDDLLTHTLQKQGKAVKKVICEHFDYTRQELYDLIKIKQITSFSDLIKQYGRGTGCEICKPAVASLLASIWNDLIAKQDTIQDTNDRFLANIQRGGTYSVVPRVPGGEITPDKLMVLGQVAKKYNLYCKITGGQRIDMFGAQIQDLPDIWEELITAGFESGHAYGKAMRTVKSCVGTTWCRYGQQDSVSFAIEVEKRYRGIRSPHKLKGGVSGCIRECAEARSKDFGIIATEKGYNLYVCGNGGANPQHAQLFAQDINENTVIKYLDRFLMYYIKTAAPLTRTAKWLNDLEGGLDHLKDVVIKDSLGMAKEFEYEMEQLVQAYQCEWKAVVENPELRQKFRPFVNTDKAGSQVQFVSIREQKMPEPWTK